MRVSATARQRVTWRIGLGTAWPSLRKPSVERLFMEILAAMVTAVELVSSDR
jgi:hypothetical protein